MDQVLDPASRALGQGIQGGIGLNDDTTLKQADHYQGYQEKWGTRGERRKKIDSQREVKDEGGGEFWDEKKGKKTLI